MFLFNLCDRNNLKNWRGSTQTEIYFQYMCNYNIYFFLLYRGLVHHHHRILNIPKRLWPIKAHETLYMATYVALLGCIIQVYPSISKYIQVYPSIFKYIQVYSSIFKYIQIYPSISKYIQVYPSISKYIQVYPSIF